MSKTARPDDLRPRLCAAAATSLRSLAGISDGDPVVAAVSGGADSVALLLMLDRASREGLMRLRITVAHLHHGIRGQSADRDLEFVRALAGELGLRFVAGKADVPAISAAEGGGIEAAARMARYAFLADVARDSGSRAVATGHTLDDQAETVLYRIIRGAGSRGLAGIIPSRPICTDPSVLLVRPILGITRAEIAEFLRLESRDHREDETNLDPRYTRNRVRLELMPVLESINPRAKAHLAALASEFSARKAEQAKEPPAPEAKGLLRPSAGRDAADFAQEARSAFEAAGGDPGRLERRHFTALASLLADSDAKGLAVNLPCGFAAVRTGDIARIVPPRSEVERRIEEALLPLGGSVRAGGLVLGASGPYQPSDALGPDPSGMTERLDLDLIELPLRVRGRRDADRFHPLGGPGRTKLKEFLRAAGIPPGMRDRVPLVTDASGRIVWVVPHRICEWAKVGPGTTRVVELRAERSEA